jgi:hypothetical protein
LSAFEWVFVDVAAREAAAPGGADRLPNSPELRE